LPPERKTILIVENDEALRAALCALFRRSPYTVSGVSLGDAVGRLERGEHPDLIIADLWGDPPACDPLAECLYGRGDEGRVLCLSSRSCPRAAEGSCISKFRLPDPVPRREELLEVVTRLLA
jgi:hypothetical protein